MFKIILLIFVSLSTLCANIQAIVSIVPEQTFLKAIGGDKVTVSVMVQEGNSPHTYEPKPSQMIAVAKADIYLGMDVEFEQVWLPKFQSLNPKMQYIDLTQGIQKMPLQVLQHHRHKATNTPKHKGLDPHIWTAPSNVKIIAQNIYKALAHYDKSHADYYKKNLDTFLISIDKTDTQIKEILSVLKKNRNFMVFHPSWGYFAKAYKLQQIAVEVEGKSPKPKALVALIKQAKQKQVNAIVTQASFSDSAAKIIAKALDIPVVKISPMATKWSDNLLQLAKTIAKRDE